MAPKLKYSWHTAWCWESHCLLKLSIKNMQSTGQPFNVRVFWIIHWTLNSNAKLLILCCEYNVILFLLLHSLHLILWLLSLHSLLSLILIWIVAHWSVIACMLWNSCQHFGSTCCLHHHVGPWNGSRKFYVNICCHLSDPVYYIPNFSHHTNLIQNFMCITHRSSACILHFMLNTGVAFLQAYSYGYMLFRQKRHSSCRTTDCGFFVSTTPILATGCPKRSGF